MLSIEAVGEYPLDGWKFNDAINLWKDYRKFLQGHTSAKFVFSTKEDSGFGTGYSSSHSYAFISGELFQQLQESAKLAWPGSGGYGKGCWYSNTHFVYPNGQKGNEGGTSPFFASQLNLFFNNFVAAGIPSDILSDYQFYLGSPQELIVVADQVIKCLEEAKKVYEAELKTENGEGGQNGKPTTGSAIPKWVWWASGLAVGAIVVKKAFFRRR